MDEPLRASRLRRGAPVGWSIISGILLLLGIGLGITAFGMSVYLMVRDKGNIRLIQGVPPKNNEVFNLQGPGIDVSPSIPANSITFSNTGVLSNVAGSGIAVSSATGDVTISNTGVLTVNGRAPLTGNILLSPGSGISIVNGVGSNQIDIINTGVLSVTGASGLSATTTAGAATVTHDLTVQTALADADVNGPQVRYTGLVNGTGETGNWTIVELDLVDGGQGAVGSNSWQVPSLGLYDVRAHCTTDGNATDYQMIHAMLTFGAHVGGRSSTGVPSAHDSFASIQVSALVHAGCSGCPVSVGDALTLQILVEGAESLMDCDLQVAKLI